MRQLTLAIICLLLSATASAQRGEGEERFITYVPAESATATPGVEYRGDNLKMGRIFVSADLLAGLPFDIKMEEKRGAYMHTVPAIRADLAAGGKSYQLTAYISGEEMSFQSAIQAYKQRAAVMEAVDTAITSGQPVTLTLVSLQSGETKVIHDGAFTAQ